MTISFLLVLVVVQAVALAAGGVVVAWLIGGRAIQAMRVDLDAAQQALKMQQIIDDRVQARVQGVQIDAAGRIVRPPRGLPEQPPAPNVRTSRIIDEVHEAEREANRIMGDAEFSKRDDYAYSQQPPMEA